MDGLIKPVTEKLTKRAPVPRIIHISAPTDSFFEQPIKDVVTFSFGTTMAEVVVANFINGEFLPTSSHIPSFDPSTGKIWAKIPDSGEEEINRAVTAAKEAFKTYVLIGSRLGVGWFRFVRDPGPTGTGI